MNKSENEKSRALPALLLININERVKAFFLQLFHAFFRVFLILKGTCYHAVEHAVPIRLLFQFGFRFDFLLFKSKSLSQPPSVCFGKNTQEAVITQKNGSMHNKAAGSSAAHGYESYALEGASASTKRWRGIVHNEVPDITVYYAFLRATEKAGLPPIRLHDIRHTHATILLGIHLKLYLRLGHSTVSMTLDIYSHVIPTMQKEAVAALDRLVVK
jgi:hypothetical protein